MNSEQRQFAANTISLQQYVFGKLYLLWRWIMLFDCHHSPNRGDYLRRLLTIYCRYCRYIMLFIPYGSTGPSSFYLPNTLTTGSTGSTWSLKYKFLWESYGSGTSSVCESYGEPSLRDRRDGGVLCGPETDKMRRERENVSSERNIHSVSGWDISNMMGWWSFLKNFPF